MPLSYQQQRAFFRTFGYLKLQALIVDDLEWIDDEFEAVFRQRGVAHDGQETTSVVPFVDSSARLCALLESDQLEATLMALLGPTANYLGSDGKYYSGDTPWHCDGRHEIGTYLKVAFYLDELGPANGALRVLPGTHRSDTGGFANAVFDALSRSKLSGDRIPAVAISSSPGDAIIFNHNLLHSSWGGGPNRRMFTMNFGSRCTTDEERAELMSYIAVHMAPYGMEQTSSDTMRDGASPRRLAHLEQPREYDDFLKAHAVAAPGNMSTSPSAGAG
jgi:hypothetical protein